MGFVLFALFTLLVLSFYCWCCLTSLRVGLLTVFAVDYIVVGYCVVCYVDGLRFVCFWLVVMCCC